MFVKRNRQRIYLTLLVLLVFLLSLLRFIQVAPDWCSLDAVTAALSSNICRRTFWRRSNVRDICDTYSQISADGVVSMASADLQKSLLPVSSPLGDTGNSDKFSIQILSYDRVEILNRTLRHYAAMEEAVRIVVQWNNPRDRATISGVMADIRRERRTDGAGRPVGDKVRVAYQDSNHLMNRYGVSGHVTTPAVLLLDDDLLISHSDVRRAFRVWRDHPHRLVGLFPRAHTLVGARYQYVAPVYVASGNYTLVLTGAAFTHRDILRRFAAFVTPGLARFVNLITNCEDLLFNVFMSLRSWDGCAGIAVTPHGVLHHLSSGDDTASALWELRDHFSVRSFCLHTFLTLYSAPSASVFRRMNDTGTHPHTLLTNCPRDYP